MLMPGIFTAFCCRFFKETFGAYEYIDKPDQMPMRAKRITVYAICNGYKLLQVECNPVNKK